MAVAATARIPAVVIGVVAARCGYGAPAADHDLVAIPVISVRVQPHPRARASCTLSLQSHCCSRAVCSFLSI
ncbi:hypothetical protein PF010_g11825 [Phytophthora fragariae]|uniref:Uncharacterized protein n=1 Tax=Phytophthora fragariae TaxID=53985 RepID=A0A6G0L5G7_9STRA|nr:hypothetical protein PF010_g11825 [Phytophthora fragariae]KAE9227112.1 hypothetical protein PF004_g11455 [Phytophthora fragariae]